MWTSTGSSSGPTPASTSKLSVSSTATPPFAPPRTEIEPREGFERSGMATAATNMKQTEAAVQSVQDGVRMMTVIKGPDAPKDTRYTLNLPAGTHLEEASPSYDADSARPEDDSDVPMTGYVIVGADDAVLGEIEAPWAKDANGKSVPTHYTLDGNQLTQTVDHAGAAYPVVADPTVSLGWWIYVRWSRGEVKSVQHKIGGGVAAATAVCQVVPNSVTKNACLALSGYTLVHLGTVFVRAAKKSARSRLSGPTHRSTEPGSMPAAAEPPLCGRNRHEQAISHRDEGGLIGPGLGSSLLRRLRARAGRPLRRADALRRQHQHLRRRHHSRNGRYLVRHQPPPHPHDGLTNLIAR